MSFLDEVFGEDKFLRNDHISNIQYLLTSVGSSRYQPIVFFVRPRQEAYKIFVTLFEQATFDLRIEKSLSYTI